MKKQEAKQKQPWVRWVRKGTALWRNYKELGWTVPLPQKELNDSAARFDTINDRELWRRCVAELTKDGTELVPLGEVMQEYEHQDAAGEGGYNKDLYLSLGYGEQDNKGAKSGKKVNAWWEKYCDRRGWTMPQTRKELINSESPPATLYVYNIPLWRRCVADLTKDGTKLVPYGKVLEEYIRRLGENLKAYIRRIEQMLKAREKAFEEDEADEAEAEEAKREAAVTDEDIYGKDGGWFARIMDGKDPEGAKALDEVYKKHRGEDHSCDFDFDDEGAGEGEGGDKKTVNKWDDWKSFCPNVVNGKKIVPLYDKVNDDGTPKEGYDKDLHLLPGYEERDGKVVKVAGGKKRTKAEKTKKTQKTRKSKDDTK